MASTIRVDNIQGTNGANYMVNGYNQRPGQIIEYLTNPCDGSTVTGASGTYTWPSVSTWSLSYSWVDTPGSNISYTPPPGTTKVIYKFDFATWWNSAHAISHHTFYIDGVEVLWSRHSRSGYYHEYRGPFEWVINIGGTPNTNTGRVANWNTSKNLKMQWMCYGGSDQMYLHGTYYWGGTGGTYFSMPILSITAVA